MFTQYIHDVVRIEVELVRHTKGERGGCHEHWSRKIILHFANGTNCDIVAFADKAGALVMPHDAVAPILDPAARRLLDSLAADAERDSKSPYWEPFPTDDVIGDDVKMDAADRRERDRAANVAADRAADAVGEFYREFGS